MTGRSDFVEERRSNLFLVVHIYNFQKVCTYFHVKAIQDTSKEGYLIWMNIIPHIRKTSRYTIGVRIENKFLDLLELSYQTYFTSKENKSKKISECIFVLDTLKFLVSVAWEAKLISHKQYEEIALKLNEVGKMFGGWRNSLTNPEKKNRTLS